MKDQQEGNRSTRPGSSPSTPRGKQRTNTRESQRSFVRWSDVYAGLTVKELALSDAVATIFRLNGQLMNERFLARTKQTNLPLTAAFVLNNMKECLALINQAINELHPNDPS